MDEEKRRAHPRVPANISVNVRTPDGQITKTERISNVSLGGVFIEMADPLKFGTELGLEFMLPDAPRVIRCSGLIVWTTKTEPARFPGRSGVGVRLMNLTISDMRVLAEFIESSLRP